MVVADPEPAGLVETDGAGERLSNRLSCPINDRDSRAIADAARDRVEETVVLDKEKSAQRVTSM